MLPVLHAEQQLAALEVVSFPNMKPAHRNQLLREKQTALRSNRSRESRPEDFAAIGIPVTYVTKEPM